MRARQQGVAVRTGEPQQGLGHAAGSQPASDRSLVRSGRTQCDDWSSGGRQS